MKYSKDGLSALATEFGFSDVYFFSMRLANKEKYKKIFSFDKDHKKSLIKYIEHVKSVVIQMEEILEEYEFDRKAYGLILRKNELSRNKRNITRVYDNDYQSVFKLREEKDFISIRKQIVERWEKIIKLLENNSHEKAS